MTETEKEQRRYANHDSVVHEVDDFVKDWMKNAKKISNGRKAA